MNDILFGLLAWIFLAGIVSAVFFVYQKKQDDEKTEEFWSKALKEAENRARKIIDDEKSLLQRERDAFVKKFEDDRLSIVERERRISELEAKLNEKDVRLDIRFEELEKKLEQAFSKELNLEKLEGERKESLERLQKELSIISGMDESEAKELLLTRTEEKFEKDILSLLEKKQKELKIRESELAREILIKSIQQYAGDVTAETTQTLIHLDSDDIKWKLIWKEGRNIIAFERATGVSLIIDDTPDTVFISSFDLFRRYIAKKSLEALIEDKRIQPARIEEIVEENQKDAEKVIYDLWQKTLNEMGIVWIPDEIIPLIGKFRFRTSYGQNILVHSKEVAYIAEAIAKLIWADASLALKGWLLHDLGKSMDHDIEGTHPEIGGKIARKYGLDEKLINIIEGHHDGVPQICIETKIVQIADAISAIRPGARRMNAEEYIKRIQEMENIAMSFSGVSKAFALSAGREIRVFVDADTISDLDAYKVAQEIAGSIEANLSYPGEVKVNLIREKRIVEYAR